MVRDRSPRTVGLGVVAALVLLSVSIPIVGNPLPLLAFSGLLLMTVGAIYLWGAETPLLAAIVITPLIPNGSEGFVASALGTHGGDIRAGLLIFFLGSYFACLPRGAPRVPRVLTGIVGSLLAVAGAGLFAAAVNSETPADFLSEASHGFGQPLIYALLIVAVAAGVQSREGARERILAAVCVGMLGEALVVAVEFGSGNAYDSARRVTRAQGTAGANFLSAMAMLGFFAGLALFTGSGTRRYRLLGLATALATLGILTVATTRGGLVGVVIGATYVFLTGIDLRARLLAIGAAIVLLGAATLIPPVSSLWTDRLDVRGGITEFDRASTWVSGARMGLDDPLSGLGSEGVTEGVESVPRYRETPAGFTSVVPHNIWVLSFAEGGVANLLATLAFSFFFGLAIWRRPRRFSLPDRFLVGGLLGLAAVALINNLFTHPEVMLPGMVMLAVLCGRAAAASEHVPVRADARADARARASSPLPAAPPRAAHI